jgi:hypothetical protein
MTRDKQLVGAAGEHLVLSRLLNLGYLAAPAPRGTRKVDVLVTLYLLLFRFQVRAIARQ